MKTAAVVALVSTIAVAAAKSTTIAYCYQHTIGGTIWDHYAIDDGQSLCDAHSTSAVWEAGQSFIVNTHGNKCTMTVNSDMPNWGSVKEGDDVAVMDCPDNHSIKCTKTDNGSVEKSCGIAGTLYGNNQVDCEW